jgi:hypothetical protein
MWGCVIAATSCRAAATFPFGSLPASRRGMNSAYRRIELPGHIGEIGGERRPPPDQDIIVARAQCRGRRQPHHLAEPPADAIALDSIADLTRYGKADAGSIAFTAILPATGLPVLAARPRLQDEGAGRRSRTFGGSLEVYAALQPFHACDFGCDFGLRPEIGRRAKIESAKTKSLRTQPLAAAASARRQHPAAAFGRHARAKAVAALAHQFARLIGPFHRKSPLRGSMRPGSCSRVFRWSTIFSENRYPLFRIVL